MLLLLKQAETAIDQGQLDEALSLLKSPAVRSHRSGQEMIGRLVEAFVIRGQNHLAAGRFAQANQDAHNAQFLGGNQPEIATLLAAIGTAIEFDQQVQRRKSQQLAAAKQQIEAGRLELGEKWLAENSLKGSTAVQLMRDIDVKKSTLEESLKFAADALDRSDLPATVRHIALARAAAATDGRVEELTRRASTIIEEQLTESFNAGRLDRVDSFIAQLATIAGDNSSPQSWRRSLDQCRTAWESIAHGEPGKAAEILRRVAIVFESAKWIQPVIQHLLNAEDALTEVRSSPLALATHESVITPPVPIKRQTPPPPIRIASLPNKFILRVDNAGSFIVYRQPSISIGPVSSAHRPDVGLLADANLPIATIDRRDDEYFIRGSAVAVNDRPAEGKLLSHGDRIALSPRCRMNFATPLAASTTAILDLTGARHAHGDVRRIILLDRDLILGPGSATHVRVEQASANCILHLRDGRLLVESKEPVEVNGSPMDRITGIPMNAHVKTGNISFVLNEC